MNKYLSLFLLFFSTVVSVHAQTYNRCATMEHLEHAIAKDPAILERMQQVEEHTQKWLASGESEKEADIIRIPVVVHVVYTTSNPSSNISDEQVLSQIQILNEDFRRLNADSVNTPPVFIPFAADTEIEFCLAQRDPDGMPSNGIVRVPTNVNSFGVGSDAVKSSATGGADPWPSNDYLNVWVCDNLNGGTLGYAQFPGDNPLTDGVVVADHYFGNIGTVSAPFDLGRTATHEVGHWLNLRHIWGDGACFADDGVTDTPRASEAHYGCVSITTNTCTDSPTDYNDMPQNYMDYSDDDCFNLFTHGQSARMRALFTNGGLRESILNSDGCLPIILSANDVILEAIPEPSGAGNCTTVEPVIEFQNYGSTNLVFFNIQYFVDGGDVQTTFWVGDLPPVASSSFTLPPINVVDDGIVHTITVTLLDPNGLPDENLANNVITATFASFSAGEAPPIIEGFEAGDFPSDWEIENPDGNNTFTITTDAANNGDYSTFIDNFNNANTGNIDELVLPEIDLKNALYPVLEFYVAHAATSTTTISDELNIMLSTDCGNTFTTIRQLVNDELTTASVTDNAFLPNNGGWEQHTIQLSPYIGVRSAIIKFSHTRGNGNNLFLDDINIQVAGVGIDTPATTMDVQLYPNPAKSQAFLNFTLEQHQKVEWQVIDKTGRIVLAQTQQGQAGNNQIAIDINELTMGMYFVVLNNGQQNVTRKLTVW